MSIEFSNVTVIKLEDWARNIRNPVDFVDYWFNFFLSPTKEEIESDIMNNINAFHWTRWKEDFEKCHEVAEGESYDCEVRGWFASYMQYLVYSLQVPSITLATHYGKESFEWVIGDWGRLHCYGVDQFVEVFVGKFGLPFEGAKVHLLHM